VARYKYEGKLRDRADEFIEALRSSNVQSEILEDSIREYSIKVSVLDPSSSGTVLIYYRPTSNSFSLGTHELKDKSIIPMLEKAWQNPQFEAASLKGIEIYVDGSFIGGVTGYGAVVLSKGKVIEELSGAVDRAEVGGTYQVAGELAAVKAALSWCHSHSIDRVTIFYDYLGIAEWATGRWKANQPLTQNYARFVRECDINVTWRKVAAHSGNKWNERADALAKKGTQSLSSAPDIEDDLIRELIEKSEAWIEFLMVQGVEASLAQPYNDQFARIFIIEDYNTVGIFDLYNTRKKRLSAYTHGFRDENLKKRIDSLWASHRLS